MPESQPKIIGLIILTSAISLEVITYVLDTYELALAQADQLLKGCNFELVSNRDDLPLRYKEYKIEEYSEVLSVREIEIGLVVLPVEN